MSLHILPHTNGFEKTSNNNRYQVKPITETLTNGFFTVDHKWTVKYWNKAAEKLLKVQAGDIVGKNLWNKFAGVIPLEFYNVYHKAFLEDIPLHFEDYWAEMDAWFDVITYYADDTLSVSFKSSSHPQSENPVQRLRTLTELYRYVSEITNHCLWEWDLQANEIFWIDGGHKKIFGYPIENTLVPQSFWESRIHPDDRAGVLYRLNKIIAGGTEAKWEDQYRFQRANGEYAFVHDRGHLIYDGNKTASRMIGATQDISEKVLLENKLVQERQTRQREITHAAIMAQEAERAHIGRELHDNLGQTLAIAKLYLQMAKTYPDKMEMHLEKSAEFISNVIVEIRRISKNLVIPGTHITSLIDNIRNLIHDLSLADPVKIEFYEKGIDKKGLDEKMQVTIYRIIQEQVNNILKHSEATRAGIYLSSNKNEITLNIFDNGKGCNLSEKSSGVGIINIKSRAELYRGRVEIASKPGEGYELKVMLPLGGDVTL